MPTCGGEDFQALYRLHFRPLTRSLSTIHGIEPAADAVQEAFIRAGLRWQRVSAMQDPAGWVRRVALNLLKNERRDSARRSKILAAIQEPAPQRDPAVPMIVREALDALSPRHRTVLALHYVGGYSVVEIADSLGISDGAVKRYLFEARNRFEKEVSNDESEATGAPRSRGRR